MHRDLPREAPGRYRYTRQAFHVLSEMDIPRILDIGCGPGGQTMELTRLTQGEVIGIDTYQPYLDQLTEKIKEVAFLCSLKPFSFKMMQMILSCALRKRRLKKLEEKYRLLTDKLMYDPGGLENYNEETTTEGLELVQLKREIDNLKEDSRCYEYLEKHWKQ